MLTQVAIGSLLWVVTAVVHGFATIGALAVLRRTHAASSGLHTPRSKITLLAALMLMMFFAALAEVNIWAATYLYVGAVQALEPALYFSTVTYTTLGYGDITLDDRWRLLSAFQAANGTVMFGWTTALIYAFVQRIARHDAEHAPASKRSALTSRGTITM